MDEDFLLTNDRGVIWIFGAGPWIVIASYLHHRNLTRKPYSACDHRSPIVIIVNAPIFSIHINDGNIDVVDNLDQGGCSDLMAPINYPRQWDAMLTGGIVGGSGASNFSLIQRSVDEI